MEKHTTVSQSKGRKMKGVEWVGKPFHMVVKEVDHPRIQDPQDAIIRLTSAGICGTDLHTFHGRLTTKAPLTMGHESLGIVEEVGAGVSNLKKGDRVLVYDEICCGFCANCVVELSQFCLTVNPPSDISFFGIGEPGRQFNGGQGIYH